MRILAVVPPALGKRLSHLVVSDEGKEELLLFALPSLALIHKHRLKGVEVGAMTADPWGEALSVCDLSAGIVRVVAWPLPGMPELE